MNSLINRVYNGLFKELQHKCKPFTRGKCYKNIGKNYIIHMFILGQGAIEIRK
jgi:hypothetical protein